MSSSRRSFIPGATLALFCLLPASAPRGAEAAWQPTIFAEVLTALPRAYYEPGRLDARAALLAALARLEHAVPELVVDPPDASGAVRVTAKGRSQSFATADLKTWLAMGDRLLEVLRFVDQSLNDPSLRPKLEYAAIKGCVSVLDPHTLFYTPEEYGQQASRFTGSMVGVGVKLTAQETRVVVREVVAGGPAAKAGVRAGDVLLKVDELSLANLNPGIAAEKLRGQAGTPVTLTLQRPPRPAPFVVTVTRQEIVMPSVRSALLPGKVGYVQVTGFPQNVLEQFKAALTTLRKQKPKAWVLDLRGNEGGYIQQASRMAEHFLAAGIVAKAVGGKHDPNDVVWEVHVRKKAKAQPKPGQPPAKADPADEKVEPVTEPLVVLVNRRSASAAEILAGALSVHDRALLIGEPTWGKGSVQKIFSFPTGAALKLTMWQYLIRGDIAVQAASVVPDFELWPVAVAAEQTVYVTATEAEREGTSGQALGGLSGVPAWRGRPLRPAVRYLAGAGDALRDLAVRIALAAPKAKRDAVVEAARPLVEAFAAAEEQRVIEQMKKDRGLDWTAAPAGAAAPRLTAALASSHAEPGAGDPLVLTLTVKNTGAAPAHRVAAVLRTFHPLLNGRELLVGRLAPGEERKATVEVTVPQDLRERWERVRAVVSAGEAAEVATAALTFHVREPARPTFQFHWLVDDRATGNGDGRLGPGEAADLRVLVRNVGPGAAGEVRADGAEPRGDLAMVRARAPLGALAAGAAAVGILAVKRGDPAAKATARPGKPGLTVTVYDKVLGADLAREILLPVVPAAGEPFIAADEVVAPKGEKVVIGAFAGPDAPGVAEVTAAARLKVEARRKNWLRVALPGGSFGFVTAEDVKPATGPAGTAGITARYEAVPPEVKVAAHDHTVAAPRFALRAEVSSPRGVQDAWVRVWNPEGQARAVDKVAYVPGAEGGVRQLAVAVDVPLQEGTNYVVVDARDVAGNQGQTRLAIFQPPGVKPEAPRPAAVEEQPKKKPKAKAGCGCATGPGGGSALAGWLVVLLLIAWRRARR